MKLIAFGIAAGAGIGAWRNLPPYPRSQPGAVVLVLVVGLVAAYLAGLRRGGANATAVAVATAEAVATSDSRAQAMVALHLHTGPTLRTAAADHEAVEAFAAGLTGRHGEHLTAADAPYVLEVDAAKRPEAQRGVPARASALPATALHETVADLLAAEGEPPD